MTWHPPARGHCSPGEGGGRGPGRNRGADGRRFLVRMAASPPRHSRGPCHGRRDRGGATTTGEGVSDDPAADDRTGRAAARGARSVLHRGPDGISGDAVADGVQGRPEDDAGGRGRGAISDASKTRRYPRSATAVAVAKARV